MSPRSLKNMIKLLEGQVENGNNSNKKKKKDGKDAVYYVWGEIANGNIYKKFIKEFKFQIF